VGALARCLEFRSALFSGTGKNQNGDGAGVSGGMPVLVADGPAAVVSSR
jgi:hypothetical protein